MSTGQTITRAAVRQEGPLPTVSAPNVDRSEPAGSRADIRRRLASRLSRAQRDCPEALDLLADLASIAREELHGCTSQLHGPYFNARNFRDVVLSERAGYSLFEMARLATRPHPQARAAVLAQAKHLVAFLESAAPAVSPSEAPAQVAEAVGELEAAYIRAAADGRIDQDEAAVLTPKAQRAAGAIAGMEATLMRMRTRPASGARA